MSGIDFASISVSMSALRAQMLANLAVLQNQLIAQQAAASQVGGQIAARAPSATATGQAVDKLA